MTAEAAPLANELVIDRVLEASPAAIYRCWTEPELIKRWFTPKPYETIHAELDVRPGGGSYIVMRAPDGTEIPNRGVYLEAVPGRRIVFTDAYTAGWIPTGNSFFTGVVELTDLGGGRTRYVARARHWRAEDAKAHEEMGFHVGWNAATDQLEALARTL